MCEYCKNMPTKYEGFYVEYHKQTAPDEENEVLIESKYCPNCGRKLIESVENLNKENNDRKLVEWSKNNMNKEIHFYTYDTMISNVDHSWLATKNKIKNGLIYISTTQMGLISTDLFKLGFRIFIHDYNNKEGYYTYEIKLGTNERTNKDIRMSHNLFNLWKSGGFNIGEL